MSHKINTTIGFSRANRNIRTALKKYFEAESYDLSYQAIMPPPSGLHGEQLMVWKSEHWGSRPFTFEGKIRNNQLKFYTINGIPWALYAALAKRLQTPLLITTASTDDMEWMQVEVKPDCSLHFIYSANENQSRGRVPPAIREFLAAHLAISSSGNAKPASTPYLPASMEPNPRLMEQEVPF